MRLAFDIETNGLLGELDKVHCIVTQDLDTGEVTSYTDNWRDALSVLLSAEEITGHNIIDFDIPAIQTIEPEFIPEWDRVTDTLIWSRLCHPDIVARDMMNGDLPTKLRGSYSLKAWGIRLKNHKGDFEGPWDTFCQEMLDYCIQDVDVTAKLYHRLEQQKFSKKSIELEHLVHRVCVEQRNKGFMFDVDKAWELAKELQKERMLLEAEFDALFPNYEVKTPFMPKANNKKLGYTKGVLTHKSQTIKFNPNSRHHIANRLKEKYNWKPDHYTEKGQPKVDETILMSLPYPEAKKLAMYFLLSKRVAALSEGRQAWLNSVDTDGRIRGSVITNGAVSGRATHRSPNLAQVPSCRVPYGTECRNLFTVPDGKVLVGVDVSGLELRALAHYLHPYDKGAYSEVVLNGDIHTFNQKAAGLETRDQAKTFIYALIFGAGAAKLGKIAGGTQHTGVKLKTKFFKEIPALKKLIDAVVFKAEDQKYIIGLDGRRLPVRSPHSSLNLLIQSAGSLICKRWLVEMEKAVVRNGWRERCHQVAWVHDETQWECDEELGDHFGRMAVAAIRDAGRYFEIRTRLDAEYKVGKTWAETH